MGSTAVASFALAQAPPPSAPVAPAPTAAQTAASPADCDRLETFLEQRHPVNPGVTLEQVRAYRTSSNVQACHDALVRLDPTATQATNSEGKPGADTSIVPSGRLFNRVSSSASPVLETVLTLSSSVETRRC